MQTATERSLEIFVLIQLAVIGLSHTVAPRAWGEFFGWLHSKGEAGVFGMAFLTLWFGSIIVAFHPVWLGLPIIITLLGWAQVVKGAIYFIFPRVGLKMLGRVKGDTTHLFRWPGLVLLVLTAVLGWNLFLRG
ncbi:MAG: hypothetical protein H0T95_13575 [Chthoniobacterales bacterium]|nr:hypothetical protein [Chthoniobacterales bacterium]